LGTESGGSSFGLGEGWSLKVASDLGDGTWIWGVIWLASAREGRELGETGNESSGLIEVKADVMKQVERR
jgi:hypothetical protein